MKIIRREVCGYIFFLLTFALLAITLLPGAVHAAHSAALVSISEITQPPDTEATLPITITSVRDYGTGTISVTYDPSVVRVIYVADGPQSTVTAWNVNNTTGVVMISAWNIAGVSGDIAFANVTFKVVGSAGRSTPLKLNVSTLKDISYTDIPIAVTDGSLRITAQEAGGSRSTASSTPTQGSTATSSPKLTPPPPPILTSPPPQTPSSSVPPTPVSSPRVTPAEGGEAGARPTTTPKRTIPAFEGICAATSVLSAYLLLRQSERRAGR